MLETLAGSADGQWRHVARLRLARVQLAQNQVSEALATLGSDDVGSFGAQFDDLRGDAHYSSGDVEAARSAWQSALDSGAEGLDVSFVQTKLDSLGVAPSPES